MAEAGHSTLDTAAAARGRRLRALWRRLRGRHDDDLRSSIAELIEEDREPATAVEQHERTLIQNVLKLRDLSAVDVAVPRADIVAVDASTSFPDLLKRFAEEQHSRLPVYRSTLDDVVGMVHVKDVLGFVAAGRTPALEHFVRRVLFVAPSVRVIDLLQQMRLTRTHMALVVDEFGGIDGLITIEDLVEQIVGEIDDEYDVETTRPEVIERPDGSVIADARAPLDELAARLGVELREGVEDDDIDTIGGLVATLVGRVPARGELIRHPTNGIEFEILDADPRRVRRIRIRNLPPRPSPDDQRPG